jgi:peptidoglycan/LPS O-acetylase OafA/YrhL
MDLQMNVLTRDLSGPEIAPAKAIRKEISRIPVLDGVRGIAILIVLLFHFAGPGSGSGFLEKGLFEVIRAGWIGVDLFFVLSGFLITRILYESKGSAFYFRNFYMRRSLRIFPLYYGLLILFFVLLPLVRPLSSPAMIQAKANQLWLFTYTSNFRYPFKQFGPLTHFWSLAVEEQFYLIWPLVIFFSPRRLAMKICAGCIIGAFILRTTCVLAGVSPHLIYVYTPLRMDTLAIGAFIALMSEGPEGIMPLMRVARWIVPSALILLFVLFWQSSLKAIDPLVQTLGFTIIGLFFGSLLVLLMGGNQASPVLRCLDNSFLRCFGKYSYCLYLIHLPLHPLLYKVFSFPSLNLQGRFHSELLALAPFLVLGTATSLLISILIWNLYEKHFLTLKKHFDYSLKPTPQTVG